MFNSGHKGHERTCLFQRCWSLCKSLPRITRYSNSVLVWRIQTVVFQLNQCNSVYQIRSNVTCKRLIPHTRTIGVVYLLLYFSFYLWNVSWWTGKRFQRRSNWQPQHPRNQTNRLKIGYSEMRTFVEQSRKNWKENFDWTETVDLQDLSRIHPPLRLRVLDPDQTDLCIHWWHLYTDVAGCSERFMATTSP